MDKHITREILAIKDMALELDLSRDTINEHLARLKKLRLQLKRNLDKFPQDYAFQISDEELELMVSQNVTP